MTTEPEDWRSRLRGALTLALKRRDDIAVSALRSAIAAIDNAEAVDAAQAPPATQTSRVAGAVSGVGAAEVPRRTLSGDEARQIVATEAEQRRAAAADYARRGAAERARRLIDEADVLTAELDRAS